MARRPCALDTELDFSFRPDSYWPEFPTTEAFLARIKGVERRAVARRLIDGEELPRLDDEELYRQAVLFVLEEELDDTKRQSWGSIHPAMLGGEFLPSTLAGEVEIARVVLCSTTSDVYEIRARPGERGGILYRIVDEYEDEGSAFEVTPTVSSAPLTFGELIDLIDTAQNVGFGPGPPFDVGLCDMDRDFNVHMGGDPETYARFATASSAFYPDLERYYAARADAWIEEINLEGWLDDLESDPLVADASDPYRRGHVPVEIPDDDELPADPFDRVITLIRLDALLMAEAECHVLGDNADYLLAVIALRRNDRPEAIRLLKKLNLG